MAHFAELDEHNIVKRVLVVNDDYLKDENGNEIEALGCAHMEAVHGGRWIKTSYNNNIRHRYAGKGFIYDKNLDVFLPPKYFDSWILDENNYEWKAPVPKPTNTPNGFYYEWNEESVNWVLIGNVISAESFRSQLSLTEKLLWDNPDTASTPSQKAVLTTFKQELPLTVGETETTELLDLLVSEGVYTQQRLDEIISKL